MYGPDPAAHGHFLLLFHRPNWHSLSMKQSSIYQSASLILIVTLSLNACAGTSSVGATNWKEEALLHDGNTIVVERSVNRGGRHEIGQQPPYSYQSLSFSMPGGDRTIQWEDKYSQDIGTANFLPMMLDTLDGNPYLVVSPMGCLAYNKWGRPNPPYVVFRYDGSTWERISITDLPSEMTAVNLIFSMPDVKVKQSGRRFISAEMIKEIVSDYRQPEYRSILREPLSREKCPQYSSGPKAPISIKPGQSTQ